MTELTCIICPNGCRMRVETADGKITVTDNLCKKGAQFAESELLHPTRSITSTVATVFEDHPFLPVKTSCEIPKENIFDAMKVINSVVVKSRVKVGDIIAENVFGADIVATSDV